MKIPCLYLGILAFPLCLHAGGQVGAELEWVKLPDQLGRQLMIQRTEDGTLLLTPNESFFPQKDLKCEGDGESEDIRELNKGESFESITGWKTGAIAEWGLWFEKAGELQLKLDSEGDLDLEVSLSEGDPQSLKTESTILSVENPGFATLRLIAAEAGSSAAFHQLKLSGTAVENAGVVRKRWRPAAAHTKFSSSKSPEHVRLWIMEMDAVPGDLDFYCPITTPFGYYGPTWKADGTVNSSFNFSLWSFKRGAPEPPIEQLSHLLAIGEPTAAFGGFDHEGTGVKIRNWEPLEGRQGQRQTLALRVEPGEIYDTYYSYFFAADEDRWRLFGVGNKYNKSKPLTSLWVGSFVEVPGPASVQRTGPYLRTMRYRGWVMDENERWYPLDEMQNGNIDKETGLTHTNRGVTEDGWFFLETGGWTFRKPPAGGETIKLSSGGKPEVSYLDPEDLAYLKTVPCRISIAKVERKGDKARITYAVESVEDSNEAILYWGSQEGLTFEDRWENQCALEISGGRQGQQIIEGIEESAPLYLRVFLKNRAGQFWSSETTIVTE